MAIARAGLSALLSEGETNSFILAKELSPLHGEQVGPMH